MRKTKFCLCLLLPAFFAGACMLIFLALPKGEGSISNEVQGRFLKVAHQTKSKIVSWIPSKQTNNAAEAIRKRIFDAVVAAQSPDPKDFDELIRLGEVLTAEEYGLWIFAHLATSEDWVTQCQNIRDSLPEPVREEIPVTTALIFLDAILSGEHERIIAATGSPMPQKMATLVPLVVRRHTNE